MKTHKFVLFVLLAALWTLATTGCNTIQGAGKDVEKAGDKIQDAAQRNK